MEVSMSDERVSLLIEGLRAADTVSEVRDAEGRVARIDRHSSYPGATHVYLDPPPSDAAIRSQWGLPAASTRPDFYPPDLPFVSAIPGHVTEGQDRRASLRVPIFSRATLRSLWRPKCRPIVPCIP
jgi:hypothetical protein